MANPQKAIIIDKDKFDAWVKETKKKNGIKSDREFCDRIGHNKNFVSITKYRSTLYTPAAKILEVVYGLKLKDILPDKAEPEKEEKKDVPPQAAVDLSDLEGMLKQTLQAVAAIQVTADDVKKGFRVQTNPRLDTESIAEGVYTGMSRFWERNKKDIIGQLRGLVFAGTFEAGKQLDEMKTNKIYVAK